VPWQKGDQRSKKATSRKTLRGGDLIAAGFSQERVFLVGSMVDALAVPTELQALCLIAFLVYALVWKWLQRSRTRYVLGVVGLVVVLSATAYGLATQERQPDVALGLVTPEEPALVITNLSGLVASQIKWSVVLWNQDAPTPFGPLPIPTQTFEFLRPTESSGPQRLFTDPVAKFVSKGQRLIGSAAVSCPTCGRGRTYVVSIVFGEGGWFYELPNDETGAILVPSRSAGVDRFLSELPNLAPLDERIFIRQLALREPTR
jgi:hypothetical protein